MQMLKMKDAARHARDAGVRSTSDTSGMICLDFPLESLEI